jgi:hypothetical protein
VMGGSKICGRRLIVLHQRLALPATTASLQRIRRPADDVMILP